MHRAVAHRLVDDDVAVANLDVVQAVGVRAYPRLELNRRALAAKIGQRHEIPSATLPTSRKLEFHSHLPFLQLCAAAPGLICPPAPPLGASSPLAELPPQCPLLRKARLMPIQQYNILRRPAAVRAVGGASGRLGRKFRAIFSVLAALKIHPIVAPARPGVSGRPSHPLNSVGRCRSRPLASPACLARFQGIVFHLSLGYTG